MPLILFVLVGSLLAVALWEFCRPRRQREFPALRRRLGNLGIWLLGVVLAGFTFSSPETFRFQLEATFGVVLPSWPIADQWLSFVAGFLLLDFLNYAVHRGQHAVPFLWRFHALHHSDPDVDVTTSVRQHPGEYVLISAAYWIAVIVLGIPAIVALSHSLTVFAAAAITHGNIRLPEWLERVLQPVVLTVDLHLIHHSVVYEEANVNFGGVLSIWDRLFGTYAGISHARCDRLVFGVRELPRRDCLKPSAMLLTPWRLARAGAGD
ncbi:MAG: sterol desaturase family protein [Alphaproteobacteria bacterium]|nr:sterol desaturase family protein [Alphaproteobacteria bacterium]